MAYLNLVTITGAIKEEPRRAVNRDGVNVYHFVLNCEERGVNYKTKNNWTNNVYVNIEAPANLIEDNDDIKKFNLGLQILVEGKLATIPMEDRIDREFAFDTTYIRAKKIIKID